MRFEIMLDKKSAEGTNDRYFHYNSTHYFQENVHQTLSSAFHFLQKNWKQWQLFAFYSYGYFVR